MFQPMLVFGGLLITLLTLVSNILAAAQNYRTSSLLLLLFYIYTVVGHAKTGTDIHWIVDDFTFWVSNLLFLYLIYKKRTISFFTLFIIIFGLLSHFLIDNGIEPFKNSEIIYHYISSFIFIYVLSYLIIVKTKDQLILCILIFSYWYFF